nr:transposase [Escherichia coli]
MQNDRQSSEIVILGVDTHLDIHVGAVTSQAGKLLGTHIIQTNQAGYLELLDWARSFGILERAGIEGTGSYGAALTRYLIKDGIYVVEVNRPDRSKRRLEWKSASTGCRKCSPDSAFRKQQGHTKNAVRCM